MGASYVRDEDPGNKYELYSANLSMRIGEQGALVAEIARSKSDLEKTGDAKEVPEETVESPVAVTEEKGDDDIEARRGNPDTGLCVTLSMSQNQEGEPKLTWRNSG